ncbi:MAG: chloride channel protein [Anaerolineae bacterium]|nr:chloride channel protein [Thermoflexales bacterium]MDW8407616.1 chloride channel protein [Anaerolineae bacterium]
MNWLNLNDKFSRMLGRLKQLGQINRRAAHLNPRHYLVIVVTFGRWTLLGAVAGLLAGLAAAIFLVTLRWASGVHTGNPGLLFALPLAGMAIVWLYARLGGTAERGNNLLIEEVHVNRQPVPLQMIPLSFLAPVVTLLFGGSIASVGTAVQMGGALADWVARLVHLSKEERRILLMAGLSGGFGAVIGAPISGAVFGMEVQSVGRVRYEGLVPCLVASVVGFEIVSALGVYAKAYPLLPNTPLEPLMAVRVALAGIVFGLCSLLFIELTHLISQSFNRLAGARRWLKPALGGLSIIVLSLLLGTQEYLGLSEPLLAAVWRGAAVAPLAFLFKLIFTALTVGSGFKGGEITPLFIIGATLGYVMAPLLGVPPLLLAAVGFVAVFAGASNTPLASTLMGAELFGGAGVEYMLIGAVVSYIFSGHRSIYAAQRLDTPKFIFEAPRRFAVRDVMSRAPAVASPNTPLPAVLTLLKQRQVKSVIVLEQADNTAHAGRIVGIVTAGDLFRRGGLSLTDRPDGDPLKLSVSHTMTARDVMTPDPQCVEENASLDEAAHIMTRQRLKRLPVINRAGDLVGVVARSDILRCIAEQAHLRIETPHLTAIEPTDRAFVRGWMRTNVATVNPDDTFATVLERLVSDPLRRVVVVDDEQRVVGIIIDRDLLDWVSGMPDEAFQATVHRWLRGETGTEHDLLDEITAEDVMSPTVYTAFDDDRPIDVIQTMIQQRVKRLVVVDHDHHLKGMIDRHDMLRAVAEKG